MLRRKKFRDIKGNLSQFITIFLMVMIGVMVYAFNDEDDACTYYWSCNTFGFNYYL